MKKIKDFIYINKNYILLFILLLLFNICMASCNLPKAKAASAITDLNDLWGKSWQFNENIDFTAFSANGAKILRTDTNLSSDIGTIGTFGDYELRPSNYNNVIGLDRYTSTNKIYLYVYDESQTSTNNTTSLDIYKNGEWLVNDRIITFIEKPVNINFTSNNETTINDIINWWNVNVVEYVTIQPTQTNNLNIYVNDILAYNDNIEFVNDSTLSINYLYSNYTTNQLDFINNLVTPLKYTANEFIANVFNASNNNMTGSSIDFAFNGSYLVGISYDYINIFGDTVSNSYGITPYDDDSIRILTFTDLQRNDTNINIRITTNNLDDFESGAVNSAFKTLFGFFNEIINIQFGFITIGQILGFILAIAIIGLIYKVWNGGNND